MERLGQCLPKISQREEPSNGQERGVVVSDRMAAWAPTEQELADLAMKYRCAPPARLSEEVLAKLGIGANATAAEERKNQD